MLEEKTNQLTSRRTEGSNDTIRLVIFFFLISGNSSHFDYYSAKTMLMDKFKTCYCYAGMWFGFIILSVVTMNNERIHFRCQSDGVNVSNIIIHRVGQIYINV